MPGWVWILIAVGAALVLGVAAWQVAARRRTARLRERFGPEYNRAIERSGGRRGDAESELAERERRREELRIRPLSHASRERYGESWRDVQAEFVDDPEGAIQRADSLLISVMDERGYPTDDFEQRAADVSVDHPDVVENYRAAHAIARANARGEANTEELRQAMRHYRALFEELLATDDEQTTTQLRERRMVNR